ncbi:ribonucleotide reductase of class Ia (aerobic), alpha subunit [Escherichia phage vB_EcoM_Shinka]|jgi:ribonucleoside-diphosphate reductase alpha chain|uniref:Ribonucleoside-diphosphate reductase n=1 Tax=Escherichia phage vB_EcoM_JB75 TaxID=2234085 RepID=A0A2Z5H3A7_9CAUD|nr:ribonucleoside-diphosphate reductase subunit alpha [Escherichia phage vB_EcoM_JB75]QLF81028.1 ribonucleotide reductase of class Ia (aerobic), alpha subunit [Escherichia phage vB_EcoM_FT]QXV73021.1 ribonucleotide reductase of class Ia (aerobic), alpha subunit [Escherichia phage vB_EcoM_Shinka]QXV82046.1 aerobic NDP reductase A subunit [Escherichia phage KarlGJung]WAX13759.1 ribonucleoside-diphosphate reductase large subunit [Escherichia phage ECO07P4]WAX14033.1 ribonucleoside-diphosphate red
MQLINVIKSSGVSQSFDPQKIIKVLSWAAEGTSVDPYELYENIKSYLRDGMTTDDIQTIVIKAAANSISVEEPDYQYVAARCLMFALRKHVYGQYEPRSFIDHISYCVNEGKYDPELLSKYSAEEITFLESKIKHERDMEFTYSGAMQLKEKYLVKDKTTGQIYETPQFAFMTIGMALHQDEPVDRLKHVIRFYEAVSTRQISLPTPIMAGCRTPTRQFSSCVVIEAGDSLKSINKASASIVEYISKRAGIGINVGMIRAEGSKIGMGEVRHTGVIPFWKHFQTAVKSCSQGGIRGGAATAYYPIWHLEVENLLVLKNNKGVEENRIRHMDYGVQLNDLMMERFGKNDYITLFSPHEMGGELYYSYFKDQNRFRELYEAAEKDPNIRKKRIKARELFELLMTERSGTARIYVQFIDNTNNYTPFIREKAPIRQSNLCCEIAIPTNDVNSPDAEIGLCTLSAFVLDNFDWQDQDKINELAEVQVRALDNLLDYQGYPVPEAEKAKKRRNLGVGVTNYAAWLASNFASYEDANDLTHELFERLQYGLIKASIKLAKEKGPCEYYSDTRWSRGELPIDWYNKKIDQIAAPKYVCDWSSLREDLKLFGIRNSTLSALMPCESSSQVSNSTNGIEPPRGPVSVKESKEGSFNQVVPNIEHNIDLYDYTWKLAKKGNKPYLTQVAIMLKWVCQSASANTYYDPQIFPKGKVPMSIMIDDLLYFWYFGGKNFYYHNTRDGSGTDDYEIETPKAEDCSSCKL